MKIEIFMKTKVLLLALVVISLAASAVFAQDDKAILEVWDQFEYYGMTAAGPALEVIHAAWNEAHPNWH
jgi:hypothetical protein